MAQYDYKLAFNIKDEMVTEKLNISLSKEQKKKLTDLADSENRKYSQQIIHMMEFYLNHHKRKRKDIGDLTELSHDLR